MALSLQKTAGLIYQYRDFNPEPNKILGRNSANAGLLEAFQHLKDNWQTTLCPIDSVTQQSLLAESQLSDGFRILPLDHPGVLQHLDVLFTPDPNLSFYAKWRQSQSQTIGLDKPSLCGLIHTLSTQAAMKLICDLVTAPLTASDALICTSIAGRDIVLNLLHSQVEFLNSQGMKATLPNLKLPVIPLGVSCHRFQQDNHKDAARQYWREKLQVKDDDAVVLYFGRLSFHAKANPYPLFLALEEAAKESNSKIHLWMVGNFANEAIEKAFFDASRMICPRINCHFLKGANEKVAREIWAGADIFASFADNVQETFGLTPIEAMAAGLPCVVTDWNGYKDTIEHGVTGFRVSTYLPAQGDLGAEFAFRYALKLDSYDRFIGNISQVTAVDIGEAKAAFLRLVNSPALRQEMGKAGRKRALQEYDWSVISRHYSMLWSELAASSKDQDKAFSDQSRHRDSVSGFPFSPDPFSLFSCYPTLTLNQLRFKARQDSVDPLLSIGKLHGVTVLNYGGSIDSEVCRIIMTGIKGNVVSYDALKQSVTPLQPASFDKHLAWLLKAGVIEPVSTQEQT